MKTKSGKTSKPHFQIQLNLPHAGTISLKIAHALRIQMESKDERYLVLREIALELQELLIPIRDQGENPPRSEAEGIRQKALRLGRDLALEIKKVRATSEQVGQHTRNLFECLEEGEEGMEVSLTAGESPNSLQRPQ